MAIFNSKLFVYQRVVGYNWPQSYLDIAPTWPSANLDELPSGSD